MAATATTGDITDSDTLTVSGASVFTLGSDGSNIILDSAANAFSGAVTLKAGSSGGQTFGNIVFVDSGAIDFDSAASADGDLFLDGGTDNTVGGTLSVTATAGGITDSATIAVTGDLTLNDVATAGITLDTLEADANVILTAAGNTAITNDAALALQGAVTGTLAATATGGGITDSSNLSATGNVTLNDVATAGITLDTLEADANVILTAAGNTAITNDAALALQGAVTGTLAATATTGGITDSSNLSATGNVTLNDVATAGITLDTLEADANVILTAAAICDYQ